MKTSDVVWVAYVVVVIVGASTAAGLSTRLVARRLATGTVEKRVFGREREVYDTMERYPLGRFGVGVFVLSWFVLLLGLGLLLQRLGLLY